MDKSKKILILLPDGIGLRNFAFTKFHDLGIQRGNNVTFWNNTDFKLTELGFSEIKTPGLKLNLLTDLLKKAKITVLLNKYHKEFGDEVYQTYKFKDSPKNLKGWIKQLFVKSIIALYGSTNGYYKIQRWIEKLEQSTENYKACVNQLKEHQPDFIFCTNQRPVVAIAPILAAKSLGVPTATFIFSWDNLPKATLVVDTDYYFVWSDFMKHELLKYYPHIQENQVKVTGTPQFEPHYYLNELPQREEFFKEYGLNIDHEYICFSGDDVTTSPNDPIYLNDLARSVRELNKEGANLGVLFRRCPVDFSERYDSVLDKYSDVIVSVDPLWKQQGDSWDTVMPTKEDLDLLVTIIKHTKMVVNLGSSMVFDYATMNKPCLYINYDAAENSRPGWSVNTIYKFIHFRSMPHKNAVVWVEDEFDFKHKINGIMTGNIDTIEYVNDWFNTIVQQPVKDSSARIWDTIDAILV